MKYKLLKDLYDCFYTPPEFPAQKQEIDECHHALSEVLGKPERRLVLQIIDAKDRIAEDMTITATPRRKMSSPKPRRGASKNSKSSRRNAAG